MQKCLRIENMKFTEEQYQKIVEISDEYQRNSAFGIIGDTMQNSIGAKFYETELANEIDFCESAKEMMAIFNPLTREWAHDRFVEKEKKYMWKLKSKHETYLCYLLGSSSIIPANINLAFLTESEIKEWGYNPEMFDREEVQ